MKKIFFLIIVLFVVTLTAQDKKWGKLGEAREAFSNELFKTYEPQFLGEHKPLSVRENMISFDGYTVVRMKIVGGVFWVIQKPGTKFVKEGGKIIRRWDCGNKISGFYRLSPPPLPLVEKSVSIKTDSININVNVNVDVSSPPPPTAADSPVVAVEESSSSWPLVVAATIITVGAVVIAWIFRPQKDESPKLTPPGVDTGGVK